jgi:hypothetical protein
VSLQPEIIHLAKFDAIVPQDCIGGGDVKKEIRQREG